MKEMRLFEIGFKEELHQTSYEFKFYVGAGIAEDAIAKARHFIVENNIDDWWDGIRDVELAPEEDAKAKQDEIERLKILPLARVQEVGLLLV